MLNIAMSIFYANFRRKLNENKEELQSEISDIKRQIDLKVKYATRALNNDELEKAEKLEQEITDLRSQIQEKQEELDKLKEKMELQKTINNQWK